MLNEEWGGKKPSRPLREELDLYNRYDDGESTQNMKRARVIAPTFERKDLHDFRNAGIINNRDMHLGQDSYEGLVNDLDVAGIAELKASQLKLARARGCIQLQKNLEIGE
ncbi:MAG: hypothetical protein FWE16_06170 [Firmicutes bacterium]|nr:hypothetical protein [Bacillota bacterium]